MRLELDPPDVGAGHVHLHRHGQLVLARPQRAGAVGQRLGQHRLHRAGHVDAGAAAEGLGVDRAAGAHVGGHVGDVHPQAHEAVVALGRDGVVEVLGVVGIDRERGQLAQVGAAPRRARARRRPPRPPPCAGTSGAGRGRASAPRPRRAPRGAARACARPAAPRLPVPTSTRSPSAPPRPSRVTLDRAARTAAAATRKRPRLRSTPTSGKSSRAGRPCARTLTVLRPSSASVFSARAGPRRGRSPVVLRLHRGDARPSCRCSRRWAGSTRPR